MVQKIRQQRKPKLGGLVFIHPAPLRLKATSEAGVQRMNDTCNCKSGDFLNANVFFNHFRICVSHMLNNFIHDTQSGTCGCTFQPTTFSCLSTTLAMKQSQSILAVRVTHFNQQIYL